MKFYTAIGTVKWPHTLEQGYLRRRMKSHVLNMISQLRNNKYKPKHRTCPQVFMEKLVALLVTPDKFSTGVFLLTLYFSMLSKIFHKKSLYYSHRLVVPSEPIEISKVVPSKGTSGSSLLLQCP